MGRGGSSAQQQQQLLDPDRPRFHVHPPQGWMNDPNGPVYYKGRYHMFYQHLPNACEWAFGIIWGHAVSTNLVHWEHLPPALVPTPGTLDADGCFSGSCVLDSDGTPVLLYTGVRLRSNLEAGPLPPPEQDLGMVWVESQLAAVPADPDDDLLIHWRKVESPFLQLPPSDLQLTGWRDPFIFATNTGAAPSDTGFQANGYSRDIRMLIGSGLKGQGGTALVYKSRSLLQGWELEGTLCEASNTDTGVVWECPLLVALDPVPRCLRAPTKQAAPRWLVLPGTSSSGEGDANSSNSSSTAFGSMAHKGVPDIGSGGGGSSSSRYQARLAAAPGAAAGGAGAAAGGSAPPRPPSAPAAAHPSPAAGGSSSSSRAAAMPPVATAAAAAATAAVVAAAQAVTAAAEAAPSAFADSAAVVAAAHVVVSAAARDSQSPHAADSAVAFAKLAMNDRASSFAFDRDISLNSLADMEQAASAVHAWQLQASSSGVIGSPGGGGSGSTATAFVAPPAAAAAAPPAAALPAGASSSATTAAAAPPAAATPPAAAAAPAAALTATGAAAAGAAPLPAAVATTAAAAGAPEAPPPVAGAAAGVPAAAAHDPEAPSNAAALPPGRRPVLGARLALERAATLEHWSHPGSAQLGSLEVSGEVSREVSGEVSGDGSPAELQSPPQRGQRGRRQAVASKPAPHLQLLPIVQRRQQRTAAAAAAATAAQQALDSRVGGAVLDGGGSSSSDDGGSIGTGSTEDGGSGSDYGDAISPRSRSASQQRQQQQQQVLQQQQQDDEDRFAAAFSRVRSIRARKLSQERQRSRVASMQQLQLAPAAAAAAAAADAEEAAAAEAEAEDGGEATPAPPARQWHFFTVSPDAPTNPVLYWMGHVEDTEVARFELEGAKGPYRLDLGDVLYAPNVCQDDQGRWLLWGWLQERRKMGSYNYAGCLTLPRVLHCTEDGRLVQAPIPELALLRQGAGWHQHGVRVTSEAEVPLKAAPGCVALDIELTVDRGTAFAAGLLFRSYEAEAEGGTALIYDWDRNTLEAIFNVPPNWQPVVVPQTGRHSGGLGGGQESFDPALLLTPRPNLSMSRPGSMVFSPDLAGGFDYSETATPRTATSSLGGEFSGSFLMSPQRNGINIAGPPRAPPIDLGISGLPLPPPFEGDAAGDFAGRSFGQSLPRSLSAITVPGGFFGGGTGAGADAAAAAAGGQLAVGSLPTVGGGLYRSVSDVRTGMPRASSHTTLAQLGTSLPRQQLGGFGGGGFVGGPVQAEPRRSPQPMQMIGADTDADLDFLLDELAAPMREAPPPIVEPRRVGGPLPLMQASHAVHLRILVDHSCVEVYTGTGEVLSTRIYRGQAPEGTADAGISFIAFGGTASIKHCSTYEMSSAWQQQQQQQADTAAAAAAAAKRASPKQAAAARRGGGSSRGGSGGGSPLEALSPAGPAPADGSFSALLAPGQQHQQQDVEQQLASATAPAAAGAASTAASATADALLDDLVLCISPHCSAVAPAGAFALS